MRTNNPSTPLSKEKPPLQGNLMQEDMLAMKKKPAWKWPQTKRARPSCLPHRRAAPRRP